MRFEAHIRQPVQRGKDEAPTACAEQQDYLVHRIRDVMATKHRCRYTCREREEAELECARHIAFSGAQIMSCHYARARQPRHDHQGQQRFRCWSPSRRKDSAPSHGGARPGDFEVHGRAAERCRRDTNLVRVFSAHPRHRAVVWHRRSSRRCDRNKIAFGQSRLREHRRRCDAAISLVRTVDEPGEDDQLSRRIERDRRHPPKIERWIRSRHDVEEVLRDEW